MLRIIFLSFCIFTSSYAADKTLPLISGGYQFSLENISLPDSESMGLLGGNYIINNSYFYSGLGIYGAVSGDRGGFFTGGLHMGKQIDLGADYFIEGNAFFGGGGGGSAPQGGGLMLRAAFGIGKTIEKNRYLLGVSRVAFPNGNINSNQISLAYTHTFQALHFPGWYQKKSDIARWLGDSLQLHKRQYRQLSLQFTSYIPDKGVLRRDYRQHEDMLGVLGIRYSQRISKIIWSEFETGGAMSGGIDGFAQVLGGFSARHAIIKRVTLTGGWLVGAAGGANVDTGGGLLTRAYIGFDFALSRRWSTYLDLGYISAFDGDFAAKTINLNLAYQFQGISAERLMSNMTNTSTLAWRKLRIRPGLQKYTLYARNSRKTLDHNIDVDLTSLKLDAFLTDYWFFSGQALGAFKGKAGGYAVGLVGPGYQFSDFLGFELMIGVAGGGGIAVGSGKIVQPMVNLELPVNRSWSTEFSAGYIRAFDDDLSAAVFNIGLVYRFKQPYIAALAN